jgi:hypothetical protein
LLSKRKIFEDNEERPRQEQSGAMKKLERNMSLASTVHTEFSLWLLMNLMISSHNRKLESIQDFSNKSKPHLSICENWGLGIQFMAISVEGYCLVFFMFFEN